ncbi:MAG: porin [Gammaproteobacteria bacterium]|nr:porin [Gammaproteobacteria bacterium]MDH5650850.1 porin [Gammaproteobacteria bacterium]
MKQIYGRYFLGFSFLFVTCLVDAVEVAGKQLEIYGKLHLSANYHNDGQNTGNSISSNASRIGFKGEHITPTGPLVLWQLEQTIQLDETGGQYATRNSYLGFGGAYGEILLGHNDTPYKIVAGHWGLFSDLVPDRLALLGASMLDDVKMNDRGENAALYRHGWHGWEVQVMYSAGNPTAQTSGKADDNAMAMRSYALMYKRDGLYLGIGYEDWDGMAVTNINTMNIDRAKLSGLRLAGYNWFGKLQFGFVYEKTEAADRVNFPHWVKQVYGLSLLYRFNNDYELAMHGLETTSYHNSTATGARLYGIGLFYNMDKQAQLYLAWAQTLNETNALYKVADGGHGDIVNPAQPGADPYVVSVGMIYQF